MTTINYLREYLKEEVEFYINNTVEDEAVCKLTDRQERQLIAIMVDNLYDNEWLAEQIQNCIAEEYESNIDTALSMEEY